MKNIRLIPVEYKGADYNILGIDWSATYETKKVQLKVAQLLAIDDKQVLTVCADDLVAVWPNDVDTLETFKENLTAIVCAILSALECGRINEAQAERYAIDSTLEMDFLSLILDYADGVTAGSIDLPNVAQELTDV